MADPFSVFWLRRDEVHKKHEHHAPSNPHPWNRTVARCGNHVLHVNWRLEFYDVIPVHGASYLGRASSESDAINKWKNHLMQLGIRWEDEGIEYAKG